MSEPDDPAADRDQQLYLDAVERVKDRLLFNGWATKSVQHGQNLDFVLTDGGRALIHSIRKVIRAEDAEEAFYNMQAMLGFLDACGAFGDTD